MTTNEWEHLVLRLNANYPGQQIEPPTALEWFSPLSGFPATEVWDALDRLRRTSEYLPSLKAILAAIDANWREAAAATRELEARVARAERNGKGGAKAPQEWTAIRRTLEASKALPGAPGHMLPDLARQRIDVLVDEMDEREAREQMGTLT